MLKGLTKSRDDGERGPSASFRASYTVMRCFVGSNAVGRSYLGPWNQPLS